MQQLLRLLLIAVALCVSPPVSAEPEPTPKILAKRVVADEPWNLNEVRMPVGVISDLMVVGTPKDTESGVSLAGAVFVFKIVGNNWVQVQKIVPPAPADQYKFGFSLSIEEQIDTGEAWLAVGAPGEDSGRVYLYKRNGDTFEFEQLLTGEERGDGYGYSVAINVDIPLNQSDFRWTLAAGAPFYKHPSAVRETGAVFISNLGNGGLWSQPGLPLGAAENAPEFSGRIGFSVALDGDSLIIGAPSLQVEGQNGAGGVYFASRGAAGTWVQGPAFPNPDPVIGQSFGGANFGAEVAVVKQIVPDRVPTGTYYFVVGAPERTNDVPGGQVYIFEGGPGGGIIKTQRVTRPGTPVVLDRFGSSIAIRQDLIKGDHKILIGYKPGTGQVVGSAYLYDQPDLPDPWVSKRRFLVGSVASTSNSSLRLEAVAAWNSLIVLSTSNLVTGNDAVFTTDPAIIAALNFE